MLKNNNKILLYKKIFNLKNNQNKLLIYLTFYNNKIQIKKFENIKLNFDTYVSKIILKKKYDQISLLFELFLKIKKYLIIRKYLKETKYFKDKSNIFILNIYNKLNIEYFFNHFEINEKLKNYILIYLQNIKLFFLINKQYKKNNFIFFYNNFFNNKLKNVFINLNFIKINKNKFYLKKALITIKYKIFLKCILLRQTIIPYFFKFKKIKCNYFYLNNVYKQKNIKFYNHFILLNMFNINNLNLLLILNIFNLNFNIITYNLNLLLYKNNYNLFPFYINFLNYINLKNYNFLIFNFKYYQYLKINNIYLIKYQINYQSTYKPNFTKYLTGNFLENIQQKCNKIPLHFNFQNFSIGEQNPQEMTVDKYLQFLNRKTTLSLMDRRGLIHRFFDLNIKNFYERNLKIVKSGYLINIDSIKLWVTDFYQLLFKFLNGNLKGLELLILCGFNYKKKAKLRRLLITYLIVRQNMYNLFYNHKSLSTQDPIIYFNNFEKNIINKKHVILNKNIEDENLLNQLFFLAIMVVKFITEKIIENELNHDSTILEVNRRNWYRNELYKLYRVSIFNLSKDIFKSCFNYYIDFSYYKDYNSNGLTVVMSKFAFLLKLVLPYHNLINTSITTFDNTIDLLLKNFRINQKPYCNRFRFRYLRSYKHIFYKNMYNRNLSLSMLINTLTKKNENIYFFLNLVKQLNLTLISHIYLCQIIFFRILRLLQELRLLHLESFYFNKSNLELNLRNQIPEVYIYILNILFFIKNNTFDISLYKYFWKNIYINNEVGIIVYKNLGLKKYLLNLYRLNFLDLNKNNNELKEYKQDCWTKRIKQLIIFCKNNIKKKSSKFSKRLNILKLGINSDSIPLKLLTSEINYNNIIKLKEIKKEFLLDLNKNNLIKILFIFNKVENNKKYVKPFSILVLKLFLNYIGRYRYFLFMNETCNIIFKSEKFYFNNLVYINKSFFKNYMKLANISYAIFGKSKNNFLQNNKKDLNINNE